MPHLVLTFVIRTALLHTSTPPPIFLPIFGELAALEKYDTVYTIPGYRSPFTAYRSLIKHRDPHRLLVRVGPSSPMPHVCRNIDPATAGFQDDEFILSMPPREACAALDQQHPFPLVLIVPGPFRRSPGASDIILSTLTRPDRTKVSKISSGARSG